MHEERIIEAICRRFHRIDCKPGLCHFLNSHLDEEPFKETPAETVRTYGNRIRLAPIDNSEVILVDGGEWTVLRE